jgi:molecular chaperone DnaJ
VVTQVAPHRFFRRDGSDVWLELPVTYSELALGAKIEAPTLTGKVTLKIPAGSQVDQVLRVKGKGTQRLRGVGKGDMFVRLKAVVPKKLSAEEKELLTKLEKASKEDVRKDMR